MAIYSSKILSHTRASFVVAREECHAILASADRRQLIRYKKQTVCELLIKSKPDSRHQIVESFVFDLRTRSLEKRWVLFETKERNESTKKHRQKWFVFDLGYYRHRPFELLFRFVPFCALFVHCKYSHCNNSQHFFSLAIFVQTELRETTEWEKTAVSRVLSLAFDVRVQHFFFHFIRLYNGQSIDHLVVAEAWLTTLWTPTTAHGRHAENIEAAHSQRTRKI